MYMCVYVYDYAYTCVPTTAPVLVLRYLYVYEHVSVYAPVSVYVFMGSVSSPTSSPEMKIA